MLDLRYTPRQKRNREVERCGRLIARELRDPGSVAFYWHLLWQLVRLYDQGTDRFDDVLLQVKRVAGEISEGYARRPGALLHARLRDMGLLEEIRAAPPRRVGTAPAADASTPSAPTALHTEGTGSQRRTMANPSPYGARRMVVPGGGG